MWAAAAAQGDGPPADVRAASRFQMILIGDAAGALDIARSMPRCTMPGEAENRSAYNATVGYAGYAAAGGVAQSASGFNGAPLRGTFDSAGGQHSCSTVVSGGDGGYVWSSEFACIDY